MKRRTAVALLATVALGGCQMPGFPSSNSGPKSLTAADKVALARARVMLAANHDRLKSAMAQEVSFSGTPQQSTLNGLDQAEGSLADEATKLLEQFDHSTGNNNSNLHDAINKWKSNTVGPFQSDLGSCQPRCLKGAANVLMTQTRKLDPMIETTIARVDAAPYHTSQDLTPPASEWGVGSSGGGSPSLSQSSAGSSKIGTGDVQIVTMDDVVGAMSSAHTITATAFTLSTRTHFGQALEAAHARGAVVTLELDSQAFGGALATNNETAAIFKQQGIGVLYSHGALHAKVALIDHLLVLSDRNWDNEGGFIVSDTSEADRTVVASLLQDTGSSDSRFWTVKADALAAEARVITAGTDKTLAFESESFGANNCVYDALMARAKSGTRVRVIVAAQEYDSTPLERNAIADMKAAGISVRKGTTNEKLAITSSGIWFGSTNATIGLPDQLDWGMTTADASLESQIASRFEQNWSQATPV